MPFASATLRRHTIALTLGLLLIAAHDVHARQSANAPRSAFARHATAVELSVEAFQEAWNYNEAHEWLVGASGSIWWAVRTGLALGGEFQHAHVFQRTPDAWVQGFSPLVRWRYLERPRWNLYVEVGPGISWSDRPTPPRGTLFNYLFQAETGVMKQLTGNAHAVAAFRFLHVSNNGREGLDHNPDIEALGLRAGVTLWF